MKSSYLEQTVICFLAVVAVCIFRAKEVIKEKLAKGERFCYVFRWIDDLLEAEEQAARSCNGVRCIVFSFMKYFYFIYTGKI